MLVHRDEPERHATFRRRFLKDIEALFVRVLELAREMGLLKLGTVALDGTKIHANASRHSRRLPFGPYPDQTPQFG